MKLLLVLALCCAAAFARSGVEEWRYLDNVMPQRSVEDSSFRAGREYKFFYNGQLTSGIPGSSKQHSGTRIQALVTMVFTSQNNVLMRMDNVRIGKMNRQVPHPRKMMPFDSYEDVVLEQSMKELLETTVKFTYSNGMVRDIYFDGKEHPWSANIKRGILNLIQVNLQQQHKLDTAEDQRLLNEVRTSEDNDDFTFYRVMEQTLEGECETLYTVTRQPNPKFTSGPVLNVTKSINFEKCEKRPHIKYNFRFGDSCPTCESKYNDDEKFLKSSTVTKFNITGTKESFLIESARIESQHVFVPFNEESNVVVNYINQTLVLVKSGPIQTQISEPRDPIESDSDMIYTLDWDVEREKMLMEGKSDSFRKLPGHELNKVEMVVDSLRKLVQKIGESVEEGAARHFSRLVATLRMCTRMELDKVLDFFMKRENQQWTPEETKKAKDLLPQALSLCGSKDCVHLLLKNIRENEISPIKGALAIKSLINIRAVSREIIQELIQFSETELMERSRMLKHSTWLTIGSLMNALCASNEDVLAREYKETSEKMCPRELKESYVQLLFRKGQESTKWEDNVLLVKAISNAGLDLSVFELEKLILNRDKHYPSYLRQEAILALRQLVDVMPKKIQKILMPIVMNKRENPTVRITATHILLQSLPSRPILDQLAKLTYHDTSLQLTSFLRSYMDSIANSTNPCVQRLATDMRLSLRHAKFVNTGIAHSKMVHLPFHSKKHSIGADFDFASVFANTTYIPRRLSATLNANFLGFWHKSLLQASAFSEGLEPMIERMLESEDFLSERSSENQEQRRHPRSIASEFETELRSIFSTLKIKHREQAEESRKEPKAWISLKLKEQEIALIPFNKDKIRSYLGENNANIREWESKLRSGLPINVHEATVLHEMSYKVPTTLGLPLVINVRIPAVFKLTGKIQATYDKLSQMTIKVDLKPSMVATMITDIECRSPVLDSGVKIITRVKAFAPVDAKIETDFRRNEVDDIKITVRPPTTKRDLLVLETRPVTYTREWPKTVSTWAEPEEQTIVGEEVNRVSNYKRCVGRESVGIEMCVRGQIHRTPQRHVVGTPFSLFSGQNKVVITAESSQDAPQEVVFKFNANMLDRSGRSSENMKSTYKSNSASKETSDSNERSGEAEYKNYQVKKAMKNVLKFEAEARDRRLSAELVHHRDMDGQLNKIHLKINRSPLPNSPEPFTACLNAELMHPKKPFKISEVDDKEVVGNAKLTWGRSCESENMVSLKVKAEQSKEQIELYSQNAEYKMYEKCEDKSLCSPIAQYEYLNEISQLLKYTVDLEYRNVPVVVKNMTNKVYRMLKNYYFWQTDVAQIMVRNPENRIKAVIRIDPLTLQRVNVTVKTPTENATITDLPLRIKLSPSNVKTNWWTPSTSFSDACHVSSNKVSTFDNVEYKVPMSTCFAVLAKDCSSESEFAVLMRKLTESSEQKEVKIVTPYQRIILRQDSSESIVVESNGRRYNPEESPEIVSNDRVIARIEKEGSYVKVVLPETGVKVYFDGYACNVKLSKMYQGQQCGLCGHYDEEHTDEFRTADFRQVDDVREFYKSYIIKDSQCTLPETEKICQDEECEYKPYWETSDKIESSSEELTSEKPRYRTKIIESGDQLCFSTVPLPSCPPHSYAEKYGSDKKVNYVCFERDEHRAESYERQVRMNEEVLELKSQTPTFNRLEKVIEKCSAY